MNDPKCCPACGASNRCSLADPRTATKTCWCYSVTIAPEIIEALPADQRNTACLCPACAQVLNQLKAAKAALAS
ncbi:cysteine-rich CWC family protein [Pseudomonas arcuscaelestis]|uniref:cysteine-rich CWC family protein n=1 Tax=Pseudomonas arcuscaelestis TaxID=2710591 RepID=UPI00193C9F7E|nr:cysteine-rich CWC family protein [Pseudomonas arcuscaelestis]MBM3110244.1 cysteine-rich CWC family protein [Pseudomonas arcuscaelestis]